VVQFNFEKITFRRWRMKVFRSKTDVVKELKKAHKYYYKPYPVKAKQMEEDFKIQVSPDTFLKGNKGDYLVLDRDGVRIIPKESFEAHFQDVDTTPFHIVQMNDENRTLVNMKFVSKYFIALITNTEKKEMRVVFSVPNGLSSITFRYKSKDALVKERDFLEGLIRKYRVRELSQLECQVVKSKSQKGGKQ
jgi:hypothetical protein